MTTWKIDGAHSDIGFKVKHLMISTVRGRFTTFDGTISSPGDNFAESSIEFSADTNSITTNNPGRDEHLHSNDFFNSAEFPKLTFTSTHISKKSENEYTVTGNITIKGVTKEISLDTLFNGYTIGIDGSRVSSFDIKGTIKRQEFGLTWNTILETGGVAVSDDVKLDIIAEFKEVK